VQPEKRCDLFLANDRCWKSSETEIVAALDSSWKSQYREFEFTSLRHAVSTAEKLCCIAPEISEKGRRFAVFPQQTGPEKMAAELVRSCANCSVNIEIAESNAGPKASLRNHPQRSNVKSRAGHFIVISLRRTFEHPVLCIRF